MLSQFSAWGILLIILLCRLSFSDAVPFGQHPAGEVHPTPSSPSKSSDSVRKATPTESLTEQPRSVTATPKSSTNPALTSIKTERPNTNFSNGIDANVVQAVNNVKFYEKQSPRDNSEDYSDIDSSEKSNSSNGSSLDGSVFESEMQKVPNNKDVSLAECTNEARRQNETYTRSIPLNISSIDPGEDFKMAGEAEAKKSSSVNIGEDIALCWIETTTIKEDPAFDPPKRLVIREFTISFENSATIPDNYLECDRLEGEIGLGDEETVGKTSLYEVIDENTKRSRVVNFTSVSRIGPLVVHQHRKIRCSVGAVVSKDIYEWPDGTENPKKRVEIKVGPSIRDLGVRSSEEPRDCATESLPKRPNADEGSSLSSDCISSGSCEISPSCEDSQNCNRPSTDSVCEEDDCSSASGSTEEIVPTTYPPDSNDLLSTGVTRSKAVKEPEEGLPLKNSSTLLPNKPGRASDEICDEHDTDCVSGNTTGWPITDTEEMAGGRHPEGISTEDSGESCQEGSKDCSCSGSSCSIYSSDKSRSLETGNKRAGTPTISSLMKGPNETFTEPSIKTIMPLNDSECDSGSTQCSISSESYSEEVAGTQTNTAPVRNISDNGQPTGNKEEARTLINTDDEATAQRGFIEAGDSELAETIGATAVPGNKHFSHEALKEGDTNSSTTESTEPSIPKKEDLDPFSPRTNDNKGSCDESSEDEDCTSMDSSNDDSASKSDGIITASPIEELKKSANSVTSEEPEGVTNSYNDADTSILTNESDEQTPTIEKTTRRPDSTRNSSLTGEQSTDCSASSESGDCSTLTTSSTLTEDKTILPSNQEDTTLSPELCDSSGNCGSTEAGLASMETSKVSINSTASVETSEGSTCDENSESCESPSFSTDSETCEDGSSSGDCTSKSDSSVSKSCDSASGSCSSESTDPVPVVVETKSTTTEATSKELENTSTTIDNVSTTLETRRSTVPTLSLTLLPSRGRHRLALRIKILLERVNENKGKEKLAQVEKNLLINENPNEHGNQSLLWKVKSLNDTMNIETLKAIFNCLTFEKLSEGVSNLTVFGQDKEASASMREKSVDHPLEESMAGTIEENNDNSTDESTESLARKKRETTILEEHMVKDTNITEATKAKAIRESITGIEEDLKKGMDHVLFRISNELDSQASSGVGKPAESSSSNILKILASPIDGRIHSRRRRGVKKVGAVMFVDQLKNPVKGEEIDRWSNERIVRAADGGNVRSVMEFKLLSDAVEASTNVPLGS